MTLKQTAAVGPGPGSGGAGVYARVHADSLEAIVEAGRWLDEACGSQPIPPLLIVVGLAEGHLLEVIERRAPAARVLALEPDRHMAESFRSRRDWSGWRDSGRLTHLVHPEYAGADEAWRVFPKDVNDCLLMVNPRLAAGHPDTGAAARTAQKILYGVRANAEARRQFAPRYLTNVIRNVPAFVAGRDVRALTNAFSGVPAVIAAAGPSLDAAMADLKGVTDRALLIAVDTALRPLLDAGIAPQIVTALDPGVLNARHFQALPDCPDTWLVAESALDRTATAPFDGRTFWLRVSKHQPWPWLNEHGLDAGQIDVWGSVLTAAFQVADLAGCDPIVFVGADLAFTGGRPYCRGTTYEFDWAWHAAVGRSLETAWQQHIDSTRPRASVDLHGNPTVSSGSLESFRDWVVSRARRSRRRVINATGAGILFGDGVTQGTVAASLSGRAEIPSLNDVASRASSMGSAAIAGPLEGARRLLTACDLSASPLEEWVEFSGDGFDAAAVGSVLDEAIAALQSAPHRSRAADSVTCTHPVTSSSSPGILSQLPESMARLRKALAGGASSGTPESQTGATPSVLLPQALEVLSRVQDLVSSQDLVLNATPQLSDPASNAYEWPDTTRWAVETFEALLGQAWGQAVWHPINAPFVDGAVKPRTGCAGPGSAREGRTRHACLLLALEWLRCAASLGEPSRLGLSPAIDRLSGIADAMRENSRGAAEPADVKLVIEARADDSGYTVELPLGVSRSALARILTGAFDPTDESVAIPLAGVSTTYLHVTVSLRSTGAPSRAEKSERRAVQVTPRVLSSGAVRRASVFYAAGDGVVAVVPHANESVTVSPDGSIRLRHSWPRPIVGELALPDGRVVAWGNGMHRTGQAEPAYLMFKPNHAATPAIEELPFRPAFGTWWHDRLYLTCFPGVNGDPTGLGSWTVGDGARLEVADAVVYGVHPVDDGLDLHPGRRGAAGFERQLMADGIRWTPGRAPDSISLGPLGSASCRSAAHGWTATAHPEVDLIRFESADGQVRTMTCYYAFRLAWAGRSLVVSTFERELLLFENVADILEGGRL